MEQIKQLVKRFVSDKNGHVVLMQKPNVPLAVWFIGTVAVKLMHSSGLRTVVSYIALGALVIWALLEIFRGASYFRRTLGVVVLSMILVTRLL